MKMKIVLWIGVMLGLCLIANGLYIPVKAEVAQWLMEDAWQRHVSGEEKARPWSWADTYPIARLRQPRLGVEQFVLAGSSGRVLAFGPGHVESSAPVGSSDNVVLSGHRDTHFKWLQDLKKHDEIIMDLPDGQALKYAVMTMSIRDEKETHLLTPDAHQGLRLITCYPFNAIVPGGPQRYLVDAVLL